MQVTGRKPFPLTDAVPVALREVLPDLLWSRELLWAFDLPVERVPVADLRSQLALQWWSLDGVPFAVSPCVELIEKLRGA